MKNGAQKVMKIHEKSTMGCPGVDFCEIVGLSERGQKIMIFRGLTTQAQPKDKSVQGASGSALASKK